jgi:hypothetical protein
MTSIKSICFNFRLSGWFFFVRVQTNLRKANSKTWEVRGFLKLSSEHVAREAPYFIVGILTFDRPRINRLYNFLYGNTVTSGGHFILSTLSALTSINHLSIKYRHDAHNLYINAHQRGPCSEKNLLSLTFFCHYILSNSTEYLALSHSHILTDWRLQGKRFRHSYTTYKSKSLRFELWRRWQFSLPHSLFTYLFWLDDIPSNII